MLKIGKGKKRKNKLEKEQTKKKTQHNTNNEIKFQKKKEKEKMNKRRDKFRFVTKGCAKDGKCQDLMCFFFYYKRNYFAKLLPLNSVQIFNSFHFFIFNLLHSQMENLKKEFKMHKF